MADAILQETVGVFFLKMKVPKLQNSKFKRMVIVYHIFRLK